MSQQSTHEIILSGQVQGVGFRPFVYNLAHQFKLAGIVCNNAEGVLIRFNSSTEKAQLFLDALLKKAPSVSKVTSSSLGVIPPVVYPDFRIVASKDPRQVNIPLTPDFAICESCKAELRDKNNRRFGYPFTTCTNCGPRYAITAKFPFERAHTSIDMFPMCAACQSEYQDPSDRRFHSQTNTCHHCGIPLRLTNAQGGDLNFKQNQIIRKVAELILKGSIVAIKNTNGYLLCCDAQNPTAIAQLRKKKRRPSKPFALLYPSVEKVKADFLLSNAEEKALVSAIAPIVVLSPRSGLKIDVSHVAPGLNRIGLMLPCSALLTLLMDALQTPIIATSGNMHGSPIISDEEDAIKNLSSVADYFVHHDLQITFPQDDSVVAFAGDQQIILRRSRGMAPNYISPLELGSEKILAMGAHLKSSISFLPNTHCYVSPYFGNLDNYDVLSRYQSSINQYTTLFNTGAKLLLIDKHPGYQSSILGRELAKTWKAQLIDIQHHKAHFAAVLGEHNFFNSNEKILGVIWDGTGVGDDGAVWGGEFFSYEQKKMKRLNHFDYFRWIAGDKMAGEPRLSLLSVLPDSQKSLAEAKFTKTEWKVYQKLLQSNALSTSSVGRLFDAVASLLDIVDTTTYEGEAAMLLQAVAENYSGNEFIDFLEGEEYGTIPTEMILEKIIAKKNQGTSQEQLANSFIHTLAAVIVKMAKKYDFKQIACSGGVFQNTLLISKLQEFILIEEKQLTLNFLLPLNDENISFGQLCYHQYIKL